jgi:hypothetical protein
MRVHDIVLQLGQEQRRQAGQEVNKVGPDKHIQPVRSLSRPVRRSDFQIDWQEQQRKPGVLIIRDGDVNDKQVRIRESVVEDFQGDWFKQWWVHNGGGVGDVDGRDGWGCWADEGQEKSQS